MEGQSKDAITEDNQGLSINRAYVLDNFNHYGKRGARKKQFRSINRSTVEGVTFIN